MLQATQGNSDYSIKGFVYASASYLLWGVQPIYWKLLSEAPYLEVFSHRMFWCFVVVALLAFLFGKGNFLQLLRQKRARRILAASSLMVTLTWSLFIYAVISGHIIEAALAVYINPIISLIFGVIFFKERLSTPQKIAAGLATLGVVYLVFSAGGFVILSVVLAFTFALYGALKKKGGYPTIPALAAESAIFVPLALVGIAATFLFPDLAPGREFLSFAENPHALLQSLLLVGGGVVTTVPLALFSSASNKIPLKWMGFLQYIEPFINLVIGVFLYGEVFTFAHMVCFGSISVGLVLISAELFLKSPQSRRSL